MALIKKKIPVLVECGYACDKCKKPIAMNYSSYDVNRGLRPMRDFFEEAIFEFSHYDKAYILHERCASDFFKPLNDKAPE